MLVSANVTLVMAGLDPAMTIGRHPTMGHRPSSPEMLEFVTVGMHS
jgi:hypothetical protein